MKKLIIFNIIATPKYGLGHIYRSLTLANYLKKKYSIIFMCESDSSKLCKLLIGKSYRMLIVNKINITKKIINIKPNLLINDILNTKANFIKKIKKKEINIINFEDLGSGSKYADKVINEIFEEPLNSNHNTIWGHKYFILRNEFLKANPIKFINKPKSLLITFGGSDFNNFTSKILGGIAKTCLLYNIKIYIVSGPGYLHISKLKNQIKKYKQDGNIIEYIHHAGSMVEIMKKCQIAITSNGRTIYELAHMKIPSIIISHHKREDTHSFSKKNNGFFYLGCYKRNITEKDVNKYLIILISNFNKRKTADNLLRKISFETNQKRVLKLIESII